jgi:hypothetical protein
MEKIKKKRNNYFDIIIFVRLKFVWQKKKFLNINIYLKIYAHIGILMNSSNFY